MKIESLDVNRLLVLHAVLEERSVTRAAKRLHVTPSAVSNTLAQLRDTFGDALVVRSGRGLVLTPHAEDLAPKLAAAVSALARVVEAPAAFAPGKTTRTFTLACSDAEQIAEVPRLAEAMAEKLPRASLRVMSVEQLEAAGGLASGEVDAVIAPSFGPNASGPYAKDLYVEKGVLVVREGHPRVKRTMTKSLFNALRHIDVHLAKSGGGIGHRIAEDFFAAHGMKRDIAVAVPSFTAAAAIAARTDWVAGMPRRLAASFVERMPLAVVTMPIAGVPFRMQLLWHERTDADAGARFFRDLVLEAVGAASVTASAKAPRGLR